MNMKNIIILLLITLLTVSVITLVSGASVKPMILKDVRAVTSVNPPDISNLGFGVSQVGAEYNLGQYQSGTWYEQSNVDSTGPVWIEISWDRPQTDIALLDENNIERKIYLPASTDTGNLTYAEYYWIAEDGSSYFAHSSHGRGWPDLSYYEALVQEHLARASPIPIIACTDSDGGKNYYVYGEVDYGDGTGAADTCNDMEQNVLIENYCENTVRKWINYECPNGCENGACVKDETLFYIADISGMKSTYNAGDKIKLIVKGIESDGSPASDEEGYNVQYYTYSTSNPDYYLQEFIPSGNYNGRYDDGYWYLEYWAPKKAGKYYTEVILYCSRENSECWLPSNRGGKEYRKKLYFTVTDSAKECTDSDGGKEYYVKGSISGKYIETNQDVDIDDVCTLNEQLIGSCEEGSNCKLVEYYCENGYVNLITYECPNGCKYGACIKLENKCSAKTEMNDCLDDKNCYWDQETDGCWKFDSSKQLCSDPDNGRNYEVQAHTWGFDEYAPDDKNARIRRGGKDGCTSSNRLIEHYCDKSYYIKTEYYSCPNSCKDGVCTGGPPQGIYVKLGEKFSLAEKGEAKVTDYDYMKIILNKIISIQCIKAPCPQRVEVRVEMPCNIKPSCDEETGVCEVCATSETQFELEEGESKEVFGATLTFFSTDGKRAKFVVDKSISEGGVDVEINPSEQTISYGEKAVYKVTVTDKHPIPTCPGYPEVLCEPPEPLIYKIHIKNLPFSKEYPKEIQISPGQSKSFELIIRPYEVVEAEEIREVKEGTIITTRAVGTTISKIGKVVTKPIKKVFGTTVPEEEEAVESAAVLTETIVATSTEEIAVEPQLVEEEVAIPEESEEEPTVVVASTHLMRRYKFSITAKLKSSYKVQDTAHALLAIKPKTPPTPPPFPGEKISIKLHKGWNLISLPGKLIRFDKEGLERNQKLIGFVYLKEKQEYVSLKEAEEILGGKLGEYLAKNAFWIYSRTPSTLNIWVDRKISYQDLELVKGWNLVPITEDMLGGYLADVLGDCNLEKIYLWNAGNQKWERINLEYSFSDYQFGYGFLVKAIDYCKLVGPEIMAPPAMPE